MNTTFSLLASQAGHLLSTLMLLVCIGSSSIVSASESALEQELHSYIEVFSGDDFLAQRAVMNPMVWSGISDPRLYDILAGKMLDLANKSSKDEKEQAAWYARLLAYSGNEKYIVDLQTMAEHAKAKKVRSFAAAAIPRLQKHKRWNPQISMGLENVANLEQTRVVNMLSSADYELMMIGAKRIFHVHRNNKTLLNAAHSRLVRINVESLSEPVSADAVAWLIKALGAGRHLASKPTLTKILNLKVDKKIRKYAKSSLKLLNKSN